MDETDRQEIEPMPPTTDLIRVEQEMDPDDELAYMQKMAKNSPALKQAQETLLFTQTYPKDWVVFGEKASLTSAGVERVARFFSIKLSEFENLGRQDFADEHGKGYRYVYQCRAQLRDRALYATGTYSTRDPFLGKARGEWKDLADINENDIQQAALRRCRGNAMRALLGLRQVPVEEYRRIMRLTGQKGAESSSVPFASGAKGGTSKDDSTKQVELSNIVYDIVDAGMAVAYDGGNIEIIASDAAPTDSISRDFLAKASLLALSQFEGDTGTVKGVTSYKMLRGKRLNVTLGRTKEVWEKFKDQNRD